MCYSTIILADDEHIFDILPFDKCQVNPESSELIKMSLLNQYQ